MSPKIFFLLAALILKESKERSSLVFDINCQTLPKRLTAALLLNENTAISDLRQIFRNST